MIRRNYKAFLVAIIIVMMFACMPIFAPTSAPMPTFDPNSINTLIALTANAAATQTALMLPPTLTPTATPLPTNTPTETPTPTFVFILPTLVIPPTMAVPGSSGLQYECQIISQDPLNGSTISPGAAFDMNWKVANIGKKAWFSSDTDYRYTSGDKLYKTSIYDLESSVLPGGMIDLTIKMKAPAAPGTYKTEWKIMVGKNWFCPLKLTINVN